MIVLNKIDLISEEDANRIEALLRKLNTGAEIIRSTRTDVPLASILNTGLFDFTKAMLMPGWLKELRGEHVPESLEYGISSFVYTRPRPFHPLRLEELVLNGLPNVVRSKGNIWLSALHHINVEWAGTGDLISFSHGGPWLCALEEHVRLPNPPPPLLPLTFWRFLGFLPFDMMTSCRPRLKEI